MSQNAKFGPDLDLDPTLSGTLSGTLILTILKKIIYHVTFYIYIHISGSPRSNYNRFLATLLGKIIFLLKSEKIFSNIHFDMTPLVLFLSLNHLLSEKIGVYIMHVGCRP